MKKNPQVYIYSLLLFLTAVWCAGIIAAPLLKHAGEERYAGEIYSFFSRICHQDGTRSFHADGEKFGVCIRCTSIYFGFLAGLLAFPFFRLLKRAAPPGGTLLLSIILPMAADVFLNDAGILASTVFSRVATGFLFGGLVPLWIVPCLVEGVMQISTKQKNQQQDPGVYDYVAETK
jgi:uncharacterized membrane protein